MRTRAQDAPPPLTSSPSQTRTRRTSNDHHLGELSPAKSQGTAHSHSQAMTPRKITRSISNISNLSSLEGAHSHPHQSLAAGKVSTRWAGSTLIVSGLNPEALQLFEYEDKKRLNPTNERSERRARRRGDDDADGTSFPDQLAPTKRKRTVTDAGSNDQPQSKQLKRTVAGDSFLATSQDSQQQNASSNDDGQDYYEGGTSQSVKTRGTAAAAAAASSKRGGIVKKGARRGGSSAVSKAPSRQPTPLPALLAPEEDTLSDSDLPDAFQSEHWDDPTLPEDEAQELYYNIFTPMTQFSKFVDALTKYAPEQRSTASLYALANNAAETLRVWQDEYLELERITAPHAAIPRKPATGKREPLDPMEYEDRKEADLYDYIYDAKKIGRQNPIAQKIVRDASGRELRTRHTRTKADATVTVTNSGNEDMSAGRRTRKPVTKYDGVASAGGTASRRRVGESETPDVEPTTGATTTRRGGRAAARGRGGAARGGGRGARAGGPLGKRIQEMRAESVMTFSSAASEDESVSGDESRENSAAPPDDVIVNDGEESFEPGVDVNGNGNGTPGAESADDLDGPALTSGGKRKGRPKGSKNHHKRSDAGIPKGPRQPKNNNTPGAGAGVGGTAAVAPSGSPLATPSHEGTPVSYQPGEASSGTSPAAGAPPAMITGPDGRSRKAPRSEKRSQSMVEWWARRKAKAAEEKAAKAARDQQEAAERQAAHAAAMQSAHQAAIAQGVQVPSHMMHAAPPHQPHLHTRQQHPHPHPHPHQHPHQHQMQHMQQMQYEYERTHGLPPPAPPQHTPHLNHGPRNGQQHHQPFLHQYPPNPPPPAHTGGYGPFSQPHVPRTSGTGDAGLGYVGPYAPMPSYHPGYAPVPPAQSQQQQQPPHSQPHSQGPSPGLAPQTAGLATIPGPAQHSPAGTPGLQPIHPVSLPPPMPLTTTSSTSLPPLMHHMGPSSTSAASISNLLHHNQQQAPPQTQPRHQQQQRQSHHYQPASSLPHSQQQQQQQSQSQQQQQHQPQPVQVSGAPASAPPPSWANLMNPAPGSAGYTGPATPTAPNAGAGAGARDRGDERGVATNGGVGVGAGAQGVGQGARDQHGFVRSF